MRVIFMGTPTFAVPALQALIDSPAHEVVAVYTQPPRPSGRGMKLTSSPVQQLAEVHDIPVHIPTSLKSTDEQAIFSAYNADAGVVAAYGLLLPQAILDAPRYGCINIHPSDLPRWRGAAPLHRTIMAGDTVTACCIMQMDAGLDTGAVLARTVVPVADGTTTGMLHDTMAALGAQMTLTVLDELANNRAQPVAQGTDGVTYAAKIGKDDQPIDWTKPARAILQQLLALSPVPGAVTVLNGELVKVFAGTVEAGRTDAAPGTVLDGQLLVNAGDGQAVRLTQLQRAGKARQDSSQFLQGFTISSGTVAQNP